MREHHVLYGVPHDEKIEADVNFMRALNVFKVSLCLYGRKGQYLESLMHVIKTSYGVSNGKFSVSELLIVVAIKAPNSQIGPSQLKELITDDKNEESPIFT
jgi:hypothetical protein